MDVKHEPHGDYYADPYHHPATITATTTHHGNGYSAGSSASGARQGSAGAAEAGYKCEHPGCSKTFTRKDHLVRHKANHSQLSHYCQICQRGFKRLDLLQRHEKRNICSAADYPRPKRRRSSSSSSDVSLSDSQPPLTASTQSYTNPLPNPTSFFPDPNHHHQQILTIDPTVTSTAYHPHQPPVGVGVGAELDLAFPPDNNNNNNVQMATQGGGPIEFQPDGQSGFGAWPLESWETLFNDPVFPAHQDTTSLTFDMPYNSLTPRMQESAERGQLSLASAALVVKLNNAFPDVELNLHFVTESLKHYWSHIAPTFPFIHHGTFDLEIAPNELILMMIIVGSMCTPDRRDFIKVVARIRGVLVQNCGLDMPISTLQCFALCHVHDTWFGTSDSQFTAQCLWPVMVAHSRKKGIGVTGKNDSDGPQEEEAWAAWAKEEERRRAVYCILLMDTQLSAFWNQHVSRQLSIFAHAVALPCPRNQWDALTATDWFRIRESAAGVAPGGATAPGTMGSPSTTNSNTTTAHPNANAPASSTGTGAGAGSGSGGSGGPLMIKSSHSMAHSLSSKQKSGYLPGLHPEFQVSHVSDGYSSAILSALACEALPFKVELDTAVTVEMVLMGLMAIAWDCRTRGGMGIKFKEGTKHWRGVVMNAVISVRATWEMSTSRHGPGIEQRDLRDTLAISIISILSDIPMLQVAAGATQVCGCPIGTRQYTDARRRLKLWAKTDDAWTCLWQSMRYLRQALFNDWGLYSPWAIFLTTLVAWGFGTASSGEVPEPTGNPHVQTDMLIERIIQSNERVDIIDNGLGDLIATSASLLDSEKGGGGVMQREMGQLLWRLVGNGNGRSRRMSGWSNA